MLRKHISLFVDPDANTDDRIQENPVNRVSIDVPFHTVHSLIIYQYPWLLYLPVRRFTLALISCEV